MTTATLSSLENSVAKTNVWINELAADMGCDQQHAYRALRAVLHALRDRMGIEEAANLASQLPMLVRGFYYESWRPSETPRTDERDLESFLQHIADELNDVPAEDPEAIARAVFALLSRHCTEGQIDHVKGNLPQEVKALWPS